MVDRVDGVEVRVNPEHNKTKSESPMPEELRAEVHSSASPFRLTDSFQLEVNRSDLLNHNSSEASDAFWKKKIRDLPEDERGLDGRMKLFKKYWADVAREQYGSYKDEQGQIKAEKREEYDFLNRIGIDVAIFDERKVGEFYEMYFKGGRKVQKFIDNVIQNNTDKNVVMNNIQVLEKFGQMFDAKTAKDICVLVLKAYQEPEVSVKIAEKTANHLVDTRKRLQESGESANIQVEIGRESIGDQGDKSVVVKQQDRATEHDIGEEAGFKLFIDYTEQINGKTVLATESPKEKRTETNSIATQDINKNVRERRDAQISTLEKRAQKVHRRRSRILPKVTTATMIAAVAASGVYFGREIGDHLHQSGSVTSVQREQDRSSSLYGSEVKEKPHSKHELPPLPEFKPVDYEQKALVVLLRERGKPTDFTIDQLTESLHEMGKFYNENSHGKIHFSDDAFMILPWEDVDGEFPPPDNPQDKEKVIELATKAIEKNHVDNLNKYQTTFYVSGKSYGYSVGWGGKVWLYGGADAGIEAHEWGHAGLGLGHGSVAPMHINDQKDVSEYGDGSPMGSGHVFTAPQQVEAGWFTKDQVNSVTEGGSYQINALEAYDPNGIMALRLNKPDSKDNERYYVELRGGGTNPKLRVYTWNEKKSSNTQVIKNDDGSLDRESFDDNGIHIRLEDFQNNKGHISVAFDKS